MGLGIGIDVAIATFMQAPVLSNKKSIMVWVVGVSITHTVFPMFGYLLTYFSVQTLPVVTPLIGLLAFSLVSIFLIDELKSLMQAQETSHSPYISLALILAVSWDALWSGPAKSAQVVGWSDWMIWLSFILVGAVVTLFCLSSLYLAKKLCALSHFSSGSFSVKFLDVSRWVQYSVINYFGMLALLRYTFDSHVHWVYILLMSFIFMWIVLKAMAYRSVVLNKAFL